MPGVEIAQCRRAIGQTGKNVKDAVDLDAVRDDLTEVVQMAPGARPPLGMDPRPSAARLLQDDAPNRPQGRLSRAVEAVQELLMQRPEPQRQVRAEHPEELGKLLRLPLPGAVSTESSKSKSEALMSSPSRSSESRVGKNPIGVLAAEEPPRSAAGRST